MKRLTAMRETAVLLCVLSLASAGHAAPRSVTLNFESATVETVATYIAERGGLNLITPTEGLGRVEKLHVMATTPRDALQYLARVANLSLVEVGSDTFWLGRAGTEPRQLLRATPLASEPKGKDYSFVRLQNVPPHIMAWWLDPKNNPQPIEFDMGEFGRVEKPLLNPPPVEKMPLPFTKSPSQAGIFELPEGVESIVAIDPQKALLVFGTKEGAERLKQIIAFLDKPLRQVEVEAQFVLTDEATLELLVPAPSRATPGVTGGEWQIGFVRGDFGTKLKALVEAGRLRVIGAPRITVLNNAAGQMRMSWPPAGSENYAALGVLPTINNDDTITLVMSRDIVTTGAAAPDTTQTIANVRDGDTIALFRHDQPDGAKMPIVFVTPRILRTDKK